MTSADPRIIQCLNCGKWVKNGRFLGTLHLCASPEEIAGRRRADAVQAQRFFCEEERQRLFAGLHNFKPRKNA